MAPVPPDRMQGQFFTEEHRRIRVGLALLEETLGDMHRLDRVETVERMTRILAWLRRDLLPHASWEEAWLYERLDRAAGSPWASRMLRWEHQEVRDLAILLEREFGEISQHWSSRVAFDLTAALARMDAILVAHLWKEEDVILPLLDGTLQDPTLTARIGADVS